MEFAGEVVVVTGGSGGIGKAVAIAFARAGASVAIAARNRASLEATVGELRALGCKALAVEAELAAQEGADDLSRAVSDRFGAADIVVTAAGTRDQANHTIVEMDPAKYETVVQGNILSTVLPIRALLPAMIEGRKGKIVIISGVFGIRGRARHAAGVSSKWALEGFMRSLAIEAGEHDINVNSVCPGHVEGARLATTVARLAEAHGTTPEAVRSEMEQQTVLKRLSTEADIANAVLFLASERARNITGQNLVVDAGWTI